MKATELRGDEGFTLIEMMVVVLIIGVLGTLVVPRILPQAEEAKRKIAQTEVEANIPAAIDLYLLNVGSYPSTDEGLTALWECPASVDSDRWKGPYFSRKSVKDPWGNEFRYYYPASRGGLDYDLISCGPDGVEGSEDDVTNSVQ